MWRDDFIRRGAADYIRAVTEFIFVQDEPAPVDVIFVPGSQYTEHVLKAAQMYRAGYAPWVLPSGRCSICAERFCMSPQFDSEWAWMRSVLLANGVPDSAILREDQATYTWENAQLSRAVTDRSGLSVRRAMLCCKSFHARRALLYYQAAYPDTEWLVCPADHPGCSRDTWHLTHEGRVRVLGEVRRLGDQVCDVFEMMMQKAGDADDHA